jgi:hypothetical protein
LSANRPILAAVNSIEEFDVLHKAGDFKVDPE